jgi:hypothetical protein
VVNAFTSRRIIDGESEEEETCQEESDSKEGC